jgi:23S rRNA pseudouridine1911/1915/1917 synthase
MHRIPVEKLGDVVIEEEVPSALAGERLDRIVALMADISRSDAAATIRADGVAVDGVIARAGKDRLVVGNVVSIDPTKIPMVQAPSADSNVAFRVVYEDADIIVIDKPAGLIVHPGAGHDEGTLVNGLLARYPEIADVGEVFRPGIVHRLDQGTSGLLVVARTQDSYEGLVAMLSAHLVVRRYRVLVWGHPDSESFTIDAAIGRDPQDPLRMTVVPSGKDARTHVEIVERFLDPDMSLAMCSLETGRTHQIRVHLRAIGHPVVGDSAYGGMRSGIDLKRPFLHAELLEFAHPSSGAVLTFEAPLPEDLRVFLDARRSTC